MSSAPAKRHKRPVFLGNGRLRWSWRFAAILKFSHNAKVILKIIVRVAAGKRLVRESAVMKEEGGTRLGMHFEHDTSKRVDIASGGGCQAE